MTNKEKRQYLSDLLIFRSTPFTSEMARLNKFLNSMPKILFKYREFDEYSFDMLNDEYCFLCKAGNLDDPFDCISNFNMDEVCVKNSAQLSHKTLSHIINLIFSFCNIDNSHKKGIRNLVENSITDGDIDKNKLHSNLSRVNFLTNNEKQQLFSILINFKPVNDTYFDSDGFSSVARTSLKSQEVLGICSLTTKRDNKPMWSLYGDEYRGYCVEYEVPQNDLVRSSLYPVIYERKFKNNFPLKLIDFSLNNIVRVMSNGEIRTNIGGLNELFCTKDSDWKYQDEWRLIGDCDAHCKELKVKAIYLGFRCSEENKNQILQIADKKHFSVYLMNNPTGDSKIKYSKIF